MKLLHVVSSLDPAGGGPPMVATRLAAAQAALAHEVHLLSYSTPPARQRIDDMIRSLPHHQLLQYHFIEPGGKFDRFTAGSAYREALFIESTDMVHLHGVWDPILPAVAKAARERKVPYVVAPHGMLDPWSMRQRQLKKKLALLLGYRKMLDQAAFLHVLNSDEKELIDVPGLHQRRVVIPNGIFLEEIDPIPPADAFHSSHPSLRGQPYVLFLSRLHFKKGLDYLADAFAICAARNPNLQLVVAGPDDGAQADFQSRIATSNLTDRVHIVGALYGRDKIAALAGAACFCLPSRQEGFSLAICEALACARPVVISRECHFPEVSEVHAGHIVELIPQKIADAILDVVENPPQASEMGQAGRKLVESRFTWPKIAELSIRSYDEAISPSSTRR